MWRRFLTPPHDRCRVPLEDYLLDMLGRYLLTVAIELPVLLVGLSRRHPPWVRLFAGVWLTACTYPILWLVLPPLFAERWLFLLVGETFVPVAECVLFVVAFVKPLPPDRRATARDLLAITTANGLSLGVGLIV